MRNPVDAPIDTARLFGTPESPDGTYWLTGVTSGAKVADPVVAVADGVIVATGTDPANGNGYVVQKLADGKFFAYLGLDPVSISVSKDVGVAEGAPLGVTQLGAFLEGILSDSADAWLGQGTLQDPAAYLSAHGVVLVEQPAVPADFAGPVTVIPTPTLDDPAATITVPAVTPLADPNPQPAAPDVPTGVVVDGAPAPVADPAPAAVAVPTVSADISVPVETLVFPPDAAVVPSTENWSLGVTPSPATTTSNPASVTLNITSSTDATAVAKAVSAALVAPPTPFDNLVSPTSPSKGTPVSAVSPVTTVEEVSVKGGIIGAVTSLPFWNDLGTRAINTFLQVGGGALGTGALGITHLSYKNALELGAAAAVLSIITSLTRATSIKS